jgi:hypothetical protein
MTFRMRTSVFPGDRMVFGATVTAVSTDEVGCGWVDLDVVLSVGERVASTCAVRVAVPVGENDNPWRRRGDDWKA